MAQGSVGNGWIESIHRQGFSAADDNAPLGILRGLAAVHVAMTQRHDGLTVFPTIQGVIQRLPVKLADAFQIGVAVGGDFRDIAGAQEGNRQAPGGDVALPVAERRNQSIQFQVASTRCGRSQRP